MTTGKLELDPATAARIDAGHDTFNRKSVGFDLAFQFGQGRVVINLVGDIIEAGAVGCADHHAMVIVFVPSFEVNFICFAQDFVQPDVPSVVRGSGLQIEHADRHFPDS